MKAVFLDRDGTIILDPEDERVDRVEKIKLFPDSLKALRLLSTVDFGIFIITNQAGISEGRITENEFWRIHTVVLEQLAPSGVKIIKTYICPHSAHDQCECRKPKLTMLLQAAKEFDIDLENSWMIGDRESDILAGKSAGTKTILVKTANVSVESKHALYTAPHLLGAVEYIAKHMKSEQEKYDELSLYTLQKQDVSFMHQYIVDAYAASHRDKQTKPITTAFALIGLYLHIEKNYSGKNVQWAHMYMAREKKEWPSFLPPDEKPTIALSDVLDAAPGEMRDLKIKAWARAVWNIWHESHQKVAVIAEKELKGFKPL